MKSRRTKTALAGSGIGYAIAEACLREKAELFLVDRDADLLAESAARLGTVEHVAADIAEAAAIDAAMASAAKAIGPIIGHVMRETKGRADGAEVTRLVHEQLDI